MMTEDSPADSTAGDADEERTGEHLDDLPDGAGCTDIWEHLSERREADD